MVIFISQRSTYNVNIVYKYRHAFGFADVIHSTQTPFLFAYA